MSEINFDAFHGTDKTYADSIIQEGFIFKPNDMHWLGNGVYFYLDYSLSKWWTTNPSSNFGSKIKNPAILKCSITVDNDYILDLRRLEDYTDFVNVYNKDFIPKTYDGTINLSSINNPKIMKRIRCSFCDYLHLRYDYKVLIGNFYLPGQPYLSKEHRTYAKVFDISYIETQVCVFDQQCIKHVELVR